MIYSLIAVVPAVNYSIAAAHSAPAGYFEIGSGAVLETGDTLMIGGIRICLYGPQSCLKGTSGTKSDHGEAFFAVLVALSGTQRQSARVAQQHNQTFVVCFATVGGHGLDLAVMLIAKGNGFASLRPDGFPVHAPYAVAEQGADGGGKGFWQIKDVRCPARSVP